MNRPISCLLARLGWTLTLLGAVSVVSGCGPNALGRNGPAASPVQATLTRTAHGVVHVRANDFVGLGYGLAYAYAQDNLCMFADSVLTVRGERSRHFGPNASATPPVKGQYGAASKYITLRNEDSDFFFKGYLDLAQLREGYAAASREVRDLLTGYVAGYNRYLKDKAGQFPVACRNVAWVQPITLDDMFLILAEKALHATGEVFAAEIVAGAVDAGEPVVSRGASVAVTDTAFVPRQLRTLQERGLGSNALAIGKELSDSGRGILLGAPHYPWSSTDRFYQAHMTVPGKYDAMGVVLGGIPLVVIGFNKDMAWTHTVTAATHFTTFRLTLDPADPSHTTYLVDGQRRQLEARTVTVHSRQPDGRVTARSKTFYSSHLGAVLVKPEAGLRWTAEAVHVLGDPNRYNTRLLDQWLAIGMARNVHALKAALNQVAGLPWVNTVAADRHGDVLYADASVVPHVPAERMRSACLLDRRLLAFDGARSACTWGQDPGAPPGIFAPDNGPWLLRPDYVGNSNDSYWLANARVLLTGPGTGEYSPLYGKVARELSLRTRLGFLQVEEEIAQHRRFRLTDVQRLALANRVYAAELVLPALLPACGKAADPQVRRGCKALASWDRHADQDSRGAVLFREFWTQARTIPAMWAVPFDPKDPLHTPRGVATSALAPMLVALKAAVAKLDNFHIALDGRLGDVQRELRKGMAFPIHGGHGDSDGAYNAIHMSHELSEHGYGNVAWGTSYLQAVSFDADGPIADAMLVYGQSTDPASPWHADQLPLYAGKVWPRLPFTEAQQQHMLKETPRVLRE